MSSIESSTLTKTSLLLCFRDNTTLPFFYDTVIIYQNQKLPEPPATILEVHSLHRTTPLVTSGY